MKPTRRFYVEVSNELDFPTVRSGRVRVRLFRLDPPETELFLCALDSGFIPATPKVGGVHIKFLASDREEIAPPGVLEEGRLAWTSVRFDATRVLVAGDDEIRWSILKAGLFGLLAIAEAKTKDRSVIDFIRSAYSSVPTSSFPPFPDPTEEQHQLFHQHALFSRGKKSGNLTIELFGKQQDFQPIFDRLTSLLADAKLGEWQGDSGNDIEFRSRNLQAARSLVEKHLGETFDGTFKFSVLPD